MTIKRVTIGGLSGLAMGIGSVAFYFMIWPFLEPYLYQTGREWLTILIVVPILCILVLVEVVFIERKLRLSPTLRSYWVIRIMITMAIYICLLFVFSILVTSTIDRYP